MARRTPGSLIEALLRNTVKEDQLSEAFAFMLQNHGPFADRVFAYARAPISTAREVVTQRQTSDGRVDVEVRLLHGSRPYFVWFEIKEWAREQPEQLERYARALRKLAPGRSTLVALAPSGHPVLDVAATTTPPAVPVPWQRIAFICDRLGTEIYGRLWRQQASEVSVPAGQRALLEFLQLLTWRGDVSSMDPLMPIDVLALPRIDDLISRGGAISQLLDAATEKFTETYTVDRSRSWPGPRSGASAWEGRVLTADRNRKLWLLMRSGWDAVACVALQPTDRYLLSSRGFHEVPVFTAGLLFGGEHDDVRRVLVDRDWLDDLPLDVMLYDDGKQDIQLLRWKYMSEVVTSGATLTEQAEALGEWAAESVERILQLPPPSAAS